MHIRDFNGKTVCVAGYGREGRATVAALEFHAPECEITIADRNAEIDIPNEKHWKQLGEGWLENLEKFDAVIVSPGITPDQLPDLPTITNATQIFLDSIGPNTTVIGVTGTKGKSTTASLLHAILETAGYNSSLLGNIGNPSLSYFAEGNGPEGDDYVVLEMSSYQLMRTTTSPHIALVTSFFPEHLDYHGNLDAYKEAKTNICSFQKESDMVFYFSASEGAAQIASQSPGTKVPYTEQQSPIAVIDTKLLGTHNLFNIAGASAIARHLGIEDATIVAACQQFPGLPHRLRDLGVYGGVRWVDDAISTTPESAIAAIHAVSAHLKVIIVGGKDRGYNFAKLGEVISASSIEHVITLGQSGSTIASLISGPKIHKAESMAQAVTLAKDVVESDAAYTVLLSPASPSYDMYQNYEKKGEDFEQCIREIAL